MRESRPQVKPFGGRADRRAQSARGHETRTLVTCCESRARERAFALVRRLGRNMCAARCRAAHMLRQQNAHPAGPKSQRPAARVKRESAGEMQATHDEATLSLSLSLCAPPPAAEVARTKALENCRSFRSVASRRGSGCCAAANLIENQLARTCCAPTQRRPHAFAARCEPAEKVTGRPEKVAAARGSVLHNNSPDRRGCVALPAACRVYNSSLILRPEIAHTEPVRVECVIAPCVCGRPDAAGLAWRRLPHTNGHALVAARTTHKRPEIAPVPPLIVVVVVVLVVVILMQPGHQHHQSADKFTAGRPCCLGAGEPTRAKAEPAC
ncbi:Hypothetical predicted protein [Olea europaea subsp. europaea]|uniref:Uncharacterized protein n=1 Tax=Olea europaea subsp. europaea TaxID=158383 RepID=A0A8S0V4X3_OLEEU|nr:Hypothetical predicted protein [Olea europaea subsp. europaea]